MSPLVRRTALVLAAAFVSALSVNCSDSDGTGPGGDLTVEELQSTLETQIGAGSAFLTTLYVQVANGFLGGGGFQIEDQGNGRVVISGAIDTDGDGVGDTQGTITADLTVVQNVTTAADVSFQDFPGPAGSSASGSLSVELQGGGANPILGIESDGVNMTVPGAGTFRADEIGIILDLTFPQSPFLEGYIDFGAGGNSGTIYFEPDGLGSWQTRVVGDGFEFIIP